MIGLLLITAFLSVVFGILIGSLLTARAADTRYHEAFDMGRAVERRELEKLEGMWRR